MYRWENAAGGAAFIMGKFMHMRGINLTLSEFAWEFAHIGGLVITVDD